MSTREKIDSIYDFSDRGLVELKAWLEPWFLNESEVAAAALAFDPFFDSAMALAATRDLRGYWRLGDGGFGPYADSKPASSWDNVAMVRDDRTIDMTDLSAGALPAADDDGAVQFNSPTGSGANSDSLYGLNTWGTGAFNPFGTGASEVTVMGWVKPIASASAFDGSIFSYLFNTGSLVGYALGVSWPARTVFLRGSSGTLAGPVLPTGEWTFACAVMDATSDRIYLNGALVATGSVGTGGGGNDEPHIGKVWLADGSTQTVLYGAVDEVSVWGDALTDAEIALLAGSGGLVADPDVRSVITTNGAYTIPEPGATVFSNGTFTITLPTAVGNLGGEIVVKNVGVGTITVAQAGSETVDGSATDLTLATKDAVVLVSNGTGWQIVAAYSYP